MAGGQRIDDHSSWMGKGGKHSVLPAESKTKSLEEMVPGAGALMDYEDTAEKIHAQQEKGVSKIKSHPTKPGFRN